MITIVATKSNKATYSSRRHTIEDSSTQPLKTKSIVEFVITQFWPFAFNLIFTGFKMKN
jgi:hypothetical protein